MYLYYKQFPTIHFFMHHSYYNKGVDIKLVKGIWFLKI